MSQVPDALRVYNTNVPIIIIDVANLFLTAGVDFLLGLLGRLSSLQAAGIGCFICLSVQRAMHYMTAQFKNISNDTTKMSHWVRSHSLYNLQSNHKVASCHHHESLNIHPEKHEELELRITINCARKWLTKKSSSCIGWLSYWVKSETRLQLEATWSSLQ